MNSNRIVLVIRIGVVLCIAVLVGITVVGMISPGLKAPLLTMMGSATIIVALYSSNPQAVTWQNVGTILGTTIVMSGGGYWLIDAASNSSDFEKELSAWLTGFILFFLGIHIFSSMLIPLTAAAIERIRSR